MAVVHLLLSWSHCHRVRDYRPKDRLSYKCQRELVESPHELICNSGLLLIYSMEKLLDMGWSWGLPHESCAPGLHTACCIGPGEYALISVLFTGYICSMVCRCCLLYELQEWQATTASLP